MEALRNGLITAFFRTLGCTGQKKTKPTTLNLESLALSRNFQLLDVSIPHVLETKNMIIKSSASEEACRN